MLRNKRIYLAGPEVFLPNALEVFAFRKSILEKLGFTAYSPFDGEVTLEGKRDQTLAKRIFEENCKLIRGVDLVLANCNFFRGASIDDGTAFEIGYAFQQKKRIYGYRESSLPLHLDSENRIKTSLHSSGYRIDSEGYLLNENFGNRINLMLEYSIQESGGILVIGSFETLCSRLVEFESAY